MSRGQLLVLSGLRLAFAVLGAVTIAAQVRISADAGASLANLFSYFTIQSNLFAAATLAVLGVVGLRGADLGRWDLLRGAATLYMAVTGLVYAVALRGIDVQTGEPWINEVLHVVMPLVMLADWFLAGPVRRLRPRDCLWWLVYPVAFLAYSLLRGRETGWYPYPFLEAWRIGYAGVAVNAAVILAVGLLIVAVLLLRRPGPPRVPGRRSRD